jgi:hypothetical protein
LRILCARVGPSATGRKCRKGTDLRTFSAGHPPWLPARSVRLALTGKHFLHLGRALDGRKCRRAAGLCTFSDTWHWVGPGPVAPRCRVQLLGSGLRRAPRCRAQQHGSGRHGGRVPAPCSPGSAVFTKLYGGVHRALRCSPSSMVVCTGLCGVHQALWWCVLGSMLS